MVSEKRVEFGEKTVSVRMMDESYVVSDCPQEPVQVTSLRQRRGVWCRSMGVFPGRTPPIRDVVEHAQKAHGNCAVIAWDADRVVGILTFFPVEDLVDREAYGWEQMMPYIVQDTLAVGSCVLCSLAGDEYRGKGIGRTMAELMIEWAQSRGKKRIGVFAVESGLATIHWKDSCRPPKPFWEKLGFSVVGKQTSARDWHEVRANFEGEMNEAREKGKDLWKLERFPEYFLEVESSKLPFSEFDAKFSLIRELAQA